MRDTDDTLPMILLGDFNAHIIGHYSVSTNSNGKFLQKLERDQGIRVLNLNTPTWTQGDRKTCVDYVATNKKGAETIVSARVNDEDFTTSDHDRIEVITNAKMLIIEHLKTELHEVSPSTNSRTIDGKNCIHNL